MTNQDDLNQVFGDFILKQRIAIGGMAIVYRAIHQETGQEVAIKIIHEHYVHDDIALRRLEHEVQIMQQLDHPNIIPIWDYGKVDERPYIVMPYIVGGTLADFFEQPRPIDHSTIIYLLRELAQGLDYAHREGVIHRDFKLENILLLDSGQPAISDFGIAQATAMTRLTPAGQCIGSPHYLAPEQILHKGRELDYRVDLYAFSVIAYLLFTGQYPYTGDDAVQIAVQHLRSIVKPPSLVNPTLPHSLDKIILRGMAKNPEDRYPNATFFVDTLESALIDKPNLSTVVFVDASLAISASPLMIEENILNPNHVNANETIDLNIQAAPERSHEAFVSQKDEVETRTKKPSISLYALTTTLLMIIALIGIVTVNAQMNLSPDNMPSSNRVIYDIPVSSTPEIQSTDVTTLEIAPTSNDDVLEATRLMSMLLSTMTSEPTAIQLSSTAIPANNDTNSDTNNSSGSSSDVPQSQSTSVPATTISVTVAPPTVIPPTSIPPTSVPPTVVPPTSVPPTPVPPTNPPPVVQIIETIVPPIIPTDEDGSCILPVGC